MKNRKRRGFTFVELMVVLAVMGILMMAAIPSFNTYIRSVKISEAQYNHQAIVYCMREWSLGTKNKLIVPSSFSSENEQGKSVANYLEHYDREYYDKYLKSIMEAGYTSPINEVGVVADGITYRLENGILTTTVHMGDELELKYDALNKVPDDVRMKYVH